MYKGPAETTRFFSAFLEAHERREDRTVIFFPPAVSLAAAAAAVRARTDIALGVQNIHWEKEGAYTGETAAPMAVEAGARFSLAGHSERRHGFGETDEMVARKAEAAFEAGLLPIVCVGETLEERRAGRLEEVLDRQLSAVLDRLPEQRLVILLLAYEPVWAIGTGVNATPDDASGAHTVLRSRLEKRLGQAGAQGIPILYGGSVKPDNAPDLLSAPGVDGLLVGGASLDPAGFARIAASRNSSGE
jgi:triosephosphate isomerase